MPDAELVGHCVEGDQRAWAVLVNRYRRLVYTVPNRAGLDDDESGEVFQQTFAKLAERIRSLRDPSRVRSWVVTTARRLTIDAIRRRQQARSSEVPVESMNGLADEATLPLDTLEGLERQHLVRQAIGRLGARCRRLIHMLFYHSGDIAPSYDAIAEELGVPVGSVGPTRARCLKKLLVEFRAVEAG